MPPIKFRVFSDFMLKKSTVFRKLKKIKADKKRMPAHFPGVDSDAEFVYFAESILFYVHFYK